MKRMSQQVKLLNPDHLSYFVARNRSKYVSFLRKGHFIAEIYLLPDVV